MNSPAGIHAPRAIFSRGFPSPSVHTGCLGCPEKLILSLHENAIERAIRDQKSSNRRMAREEVEVHLLLIRPWECEDHVEVLDLDIDFVDCPRAAEDGADAVGGHLFRRDVLFGHEGALEDLSIQAVVLEERTRGGDATSVDLDA